MPRERIPRVLAASDACLIHPRKSSLFGSVIHRRSSRRWPSAGPRSSKGNRGRSSSRGSGRADDPRLPESLPERPITGSIDRAMRRAGEGIRPAELRPGRPGQPLPAAPRNRGGRPVAAAPRTASLVPKPVPGSHSMTGQVTAKRLSSSRSRGLRRSGRVSASGRPKTALGASPGGSSTSAAATAAQRGSSWKISRARSRSNTHRNEAHT